MPDDVLVAQFTQGDSEAFNVLAGRYQEQLYRMAYRMLGHHEDALDAVQEILLRLLRALPNFRGQSKFTTWLYRLAANTCIDYRRQRSRKHKDLSLDLDLQISAPNQDPDTMCEHQFREYLLDQALKSLPEPQRLLIVLRDRQGLSNQEVAEVLGIEMGTLKARLHRARGALRRLLEQGVVVRGQEQHGRFQVAPDGAIM